MYTTHNPLIKLSIVPQLKYPNFRINFSKLRSLTLVVENGNDGTEKCKNKCDKSSLANHTTSLNPRKCTFEKLFCHIWEEDCRRSAHYEKEGKGTQTKELFRGTMLPKKAKTFLHLCYRKQLCTWVFCTTPPRSHLHYFTYPCCITTYLKFNGFKLQPFSHNSVGRKCGQCSIGEFLYSGWHQLGLERLKWYLFGCI